MSYKGWEQWLKVARKQLRHLGRTLDQELGNVLERHLPSQTGRLARVRVPVRSTPQRFPVRGSNYRAFHQLAGAAASNGRARLTASIPPASGVSLFSSGSRFPKSTPRGLFTNWNMTGSRFSGRMYSTASINFTHEAVSNLSLSVRCFFNALDGSALSQGNGKRANVKSFVSNESPAKLSRKDISLIRDMELFEMIHEHKAESSYAGSEKVGCYVEFEMPELKLESFVPSVTFADPSTLNTLNQEVSNYTAKIKDIESAVRRVCDGYGALPLTLDANRLRIHFPNLTMLETEKLIIELGVTLGSVHYERLGPKAAACVSENILSNFNSLSDLSNSALTYSPVLSESCSSWQNYQMV